MDAKGLNKALVALVEKKNELSALTYNDTNYDLVEEQLHDMEDTFIDKYGKDLEAALAKKYIKKAANGDVEYDVSHNEGVWVEADKFPKKEARLVIIPNPARILLMVGPNYKQEVWRAG
jgi:hypothetical protein